MFVDPSLSKIDTLIFTDNYGKIREDYIKMRNYDFIDYSHTYDLTADPDDDFLGFVPTVTEGSPGRFVLSFLIVRQLVWFQNYAESALRQNSFLVNQSNQY